MSTPQYSLEAIQEVIYLLTAGGISAENIIKAFALIDVDIRYADEIVEDCPGCEQCGESPVENSD